MIIATWLAYILAREGAGAPWPAETAQAIQVVEMETLAVLERWLRKIEEEASKLFRQKLESKPEHRADPPSAPLAHRDSQEQRAAAGNALGLSPSPSFTDDRTKIQFLRWSQTRVYRVSSGIRDEAMQERLDKIRNSVSQVMLEAVRDSVSDTDVRAALSSEG